MMDAQVINPATHRPPAASLSEMFGKRLDLYLPTLSNDDERRQFLTGQRSSFEERYNRFTQSKRVRLHPSYGLVSDFDFVLTICEIDERIRALSKGLDVGDSCPLPDCDRTLIIERADDCSCHLHPPCPSCECQHLACDTCCEAIDQ